MLYCLLMKLLLAYLIAWIILEYSESSESFLNILKYSENSKIPGSFARSSGTVPAAETLKSILQISQESQ